MDIKQIDSWYAHWVYLWCWKHWQCHYLHQSYPSMDKGIINNSIENILELLCFWWPKCINYCAHCRKLKCIHYSSCNVKLFTLYCKSDSIFKTLTTYYPCRYVDMPLSYSLITNTATQSLGRYLLRNLLGILQMCNSVWYEQYSINYF